MLLRFAAIGLIVIVLVLPVGARTDWVVDNCLYNPKNCPIVITEIESHWQDYRPPSGFWYYGVWHQTHRELLPGIWCKVHFKVVGEKEGGKEVLGVKFGLWYFNAFDELLGAHDAYATGGGAKHLYKPGKGYKVEWLTQDENLGPTHYRTILFPYKVRFADGSWWVADLDEIFNWFVDTMDWADFEFDKLFPKDIFEEAAEYQKDIDLAASMPGKMDDNGDGE